MTFPILQRTTRKMPELIQPVNWKAEAIKGVSSGIMQGLQLVSTINQLKLAKAKNDREEQLTAVSMQLHSEQARGLKLENDKKTIENQLNGMLLQSIINDNINSAEQQEREMMADYTAGLTAQSTYMPDEAKMSEVETDVSGPSVTEKTTSKKHSSFREALRSGHVINYLIPNVNRVKATVASSGPVADKIIEVENLIEEVKPYSSDLNKLSLQATSPVLANIGRELNPVSLELLKDKIDTVVVVDEKNASIIPPEILMAMTKEQGKTIDQIKESKQPISIPFNNALGGLRAGFFIDDFARMTSEAKEPEKFLKFLQQNGVPKKTIDSINQQYLTKYRTSETLQEPFTKNMIDANDKTSDANSGKNDEAITDGLYEKISKMRVPRKIDVEVGGVKMEVPTHAGKYELKERFKRILPIEGEAEKMYKQIPIAQDTDKALRGELDNKGVVNYIVEMHNTINNTIDDYNKAIANKDFKKASNLKLLAEQLYVDLKSVQENYGINIVPNKKETKADNLNQEKVEVILNNKIIRIPKDKLPEALALGAVLRK